MRKSSLKISGGGGGGGANYVAVKRLRCDGKDVGSNPTTTRNENGNWEAPCTEGALMVQLDLSGRPVI